MALFGGSSESGRSGFRKSVVLHSVSGTRTGACSCGHDVRNRSFRAAILFKYAGF